MIPQIISTHPSLSDTILCCEKNNNQLNPQHSNNNNFNFHKQRIKTKSSSLPVLYWLLWSSIIIFKLFYFFHLFIASHFLLFFCTIYQLTFFFFYFTHTSITHININLISLPSFMTKTQNYFSFFHIITEFIKTIFP